MAQAEAMDSVRIDKWLWAARFFKTRQLAQHAIELGRVLIAGQRVKPARVVRVGDEVEIRIDRLVYRITVQGLSQVRRGASEARLLYAEDEAGRTAREALQLQLRLEHAGEDAGTARPTKRDRRVLENFRRGRD